jgi:hypothetical protein
MNFQISVQDFQADLHRSIEDVTSELIRDFADKAPENFREVLDSPPPSREGSPPSRRSGTLFRTLRAYVVSPTEAEIEMEGYAVYLDPEFKESGVKGAGWADRPFISRSIAKTLEDLT